MPTNVAWLQTISGQLYPAINTLVQNLGLTYNVIVARTSAIIERQDTGLSRWQQQAVDMTAVRASLVSVDGKMTTVNANLSTIIALLETLNNNASLNAQNQQTILLAAPGACCDTYEPLIGTPEGMCQKSQQLIFTLYSIADRIATNTAPTRLPTADTIRKAFTVSYGDGVFHQLIDTAGVNKVLAAIAKVGPSHLYDIRSAAIDASLRADLKAILGTASDSNAAYAAIQTMDTSGYSQPHDIVEALLTFLDPSVIRKLWDGETFNGEGFDDDCGGPGPIEGEGWAQFSSIISSSNPTNPPWSNSKGQWDLDSPTAGGLGPVAADHVGSTIYVYNCFNDSDSGDTSTYLGTSNSDAGSIFAEVPVGETVAITVPDSLHIYCWSKARTVGSGNGVTYLTATWDEASASTHCPE